jgi:hypothetical protein
MPIVSYHLILVYRTPREGRRMMKRTLTMVIPAAMLYLPVLLRVCLGWVIFVPPFFVCFDSSCSCRLELGCVVMVVIAVAISIVERPEAKIMKGKPVRKEYMLVW